MNENHSCNKCKLSETCHPESICLKGESRGDSPALVIFMNAPSIVEDKRHRSFVSDGADLLRWLIRRMSISFEDVYIDYVLKCYPKACKDFGKKPLRMAMIQACSEYRIATLQLLKPKAVVAMGATACEAFIGSEKVGNFEGTKWTCKEPRVRDIIDKVWITYAPDYALNDPSECTTLYRTLVAAAEEAGLNPQFNPELKHYDFGF